MTYIWYKLHTYVKYTTLIYAHICETITAVKIVDMHLPNGFLVSLYISFVPSLPVPPSQIPPFQPLQSLLCYCWYGLVYISWTLCKWNHTVWILWLRIMFCDSSMLVHALIDYSCFKHFWVAFSCTNIPVFVYSLSIDGHLGCL